MGDDGGLFFLGLIIAIATVVWLIAIIVGLIIRKIRLTKGKREREEFQHSSAAKAQSTIKNDSAPTPFMTLEDKINLAMNQAQKFAEKKGLSANFEKNNANLRQDITVFTLNNKATKETIEELTIYYVYDIYSKLKTLFLDYKPEAVNLENLNADRDYLILKCQIMTYLEQFPPKEETTEDYVSLIMDLFFAPNDYERCDILAEHGREIPERVKKLLNNDRQALIEHWFGTIILKIKTNEFKYFQKNSITTLELSVFCCYKIYLLFCQKVNDTEKAAEFTKIFTKIFIEYATENEFRAENVAEDFFFTRIEAYEKIIMSKDEEKTDYLIHCFNQFVARDLNGNPFDEQIILEPTPVAYLRAKEIEGFSDELLEETMELFTTIVDAF